jgi:hypothetical protein
MQYDEKGSGYHSTPTMHKSPEEKGKKKRLVKTVKMRLRSMHETTVSMVPTPRPVLLLLLLVFLLLVLSLSPRLPHPLQLKLDDTRRPLLHTHTCMFFAFNEPTEGLHRVTVYIHVCNKHHLLLLLGHRTY